MSNFHAGWHMPEMKADEEIEGGWVVKKVNGTLRYFKKSGEALDVFLRQLEFYEEELKEHNEVG